MGPPKFLILPTVLPLFFLDFDATASLLGYIDNIFYYNLQLSNNTEFERYEVFKNLEHLHTARPQVLNGASNIRSTIRSRCFDAKVNVFSETIWGTDEIKKITKSLK